MKRKMIRNLILVAVMIVSSLNLTGCGGGALGGIASGAAGLVGGVARGAAGLARGAVGVAGTALQGAGRLGLGALRVAGAVAPAAPAILGTVAGNLQDPQAARAVGLAGQITQTALGGVAAARQGGAFTGGLANQGGGNVGLQ